MRRVVMAATAAAMCVAAAGCGNSGGGGGGSTSGVSTGAGGKVPAYAANFTPPKSGCGSYPIKMPADPDGVIAALNPDHQRALGGYADYKGSTINVVNTDSSCATFTSGRSARLRNAAADSGCS